MPRRHNLPSKQNDALHAARHSRRRYYREPVCLFESGGISQRDARLGRREQFAIKRKLGLCNPLKAQLIYMGQIMASIFKAMFPNVYWSLKGY